MKKLRILIIVLICATGIPVSAGLWTEYRITTSPSEQGASRISGNIVVWWDSGGSPILGADISDPNIPLYFELPENPTSFGGTIVTYGYSKRCADNKNHRGILAYDLSTGTESIIKDPCPGVGYTSYGGESTDGVTVVFISAASSKVYGYDLLWQSEFDIENSYCTGGPKVDGNSIVWNEPGVALFLFDLLEWQTFQVSDTPANGFDIAGNTVVQQRLFDGNNDLYSIDISDPCNPIEFPICTDANEQREPAMSGNIIVWQDNRNGNWDIYGYDISTETEFQITDNPADQTYPAICGHTVAWTDMRNGQEDIYLTILYGPVVPECLLPIQGDLNNDCKVDFTDFALMVNNWMGCNLNPPEACWQ